MAKLIMSITPHNSTSFCFMSAANVASRERADSADTDKERHSLVEAQLTAV